MEIKHTSLYWIWGMLLNSGLRLSPPQAATNPIFCSGARNQHTQGSDCHVSPHQRVFFAMYSKCSFFRDVNRTSLAYWFGCSPSACPPWLICIGFQVYNDVVRNDHDEPLASWRKTPTTGVQKHWHSLWRLQERHLPGANMIFSI